MVRGSTRNGLPPSHGPWTQMRLGSPGQQGDHRSGCICVWKSAMHGYTSNIPQSYSFSRENMWKWVLTIKYRGTLFSDKPMSVSSQVVRYPIYTCDYNYGILWLLTTSCDAPQSTTSKTLDRTICSMVNLWFLWSYYKYIFGSKWNFRMVSDKCVLNVPEAFGKTTSYHGCLHPKSPLPNGTPDDKWCVI